MSYNKTIPASPVTQAQELTKDLPIDAIARKIEHDKVGKVGKLTTLVSKAESDLTLAQDLVKSALTNDAMKTGRDFVQNLLLPAKDVIAILDVVSQVHPAVQVAVGVLKVLVQLEMDRLDNDKKIAALYYTMSDMLFVLSYLDPVFNDEDKLKTMLKKQLTVITKCMQDFGNFCDLYYKHKSVVRTILSSRYKGKLADFAKSFSDQKAELQYLTQQKAAVTVTAMKGNLETVSTQVEKIFALLDMKSSDEKKAAELVLAAGGEAMVLNDDVAIENIAKALNKKLDSSIKYTMRTDLDTMLKSNVALFDLKMKTATAQIEKAVEHSTEKILLRLDAGPHDLIEDPDIRAVWKDMQWRVNCKVRHFMDAVQLHFTQLFAKHQRGTGEIHSDHWTLLYMSKVIFRPAIGNAIDTDGSGFISVYEANHFFRKKPQGWSTPQWLAYWAVGWYKNAIAMQKRCSGLLDSIESSLDNVLPMNAQYVEDTEYAKDTLWDIRLIVGSLYSSTLGYLGEESNVNETLQRLRLEQQQAEIKAMKAQLRRPKYQLDSCETVVAVCRSEQIEVSVLSLIYLILERHAKIIDLAAKSVLDEQEFWTMASSLNHIRQAFTFRLRTVSECWRQQRLDIGQQLKTFASGIFEDWYKEFEEDYLKNEEDSDSDDSDDSSTEGYVDEEGNAGEEDETNEVAVIEEDQAASQGENKGSQDMTEAVGDENEDQDDMQVEEDDAQEDSDPEESDDSDDCDENDHVALIGDDDDDAKDDANLLVFPLPPQPELTAQQDASDDEGSDDTTPERAPRLTKKQKKEKKLEDRIVAAETKLANIEQILGSMEPLLQEVLSVIKSLAPNDAGSD